MVDLSVIDPWLAMHIAGVVIAVGAVTVTDGFLAFSHVYRGFREILTHVAPLLSLIVWAGFLLISVSGLAFLFQGRVAVGDPLFRAKMVLTGLVFVNGVFLNIRVTPKFRELTDEEIHQLPERFRMIAAVSAAVSVLGWWTLLFLAYFLL